jgi:hypothetical protein
MIVAGIVMMLAMVMLSVDVATMHLVRAELRAASDAAAKAGAEALLRTQDRNEAVKAAMKFAELNTVSGKAFKLAASDVVIGTSVQQTDNSWAFTAGGTRPNAVRINSAMTNGSASGAVTLAFGKVFGSGGFTPTKTATASAMEQEICLCIDRSASMSFNHLGIDWLYPSGGDYNKRPKGASRWDSLLTAVGLYVDAVENTAVPSRLALVTWASDPGISTVGVKKATKDKYDIDYKKKKKFKDKGKSGPGEGDEDEAMLSPLTASTDASLSNNYDGIVSSLMQRTEFPIYGGTNMAAGIDRGVKVLTGKDVRPFAQKAIILMTDGQWNAGRDPVKAAEDARDKGIMIHVVTFLPEALSDDAKAVAQTTGGRYFHANNEAELIAAFEKLARTLPVVLTD